MLTIVNVLGVRRAATINNILTLGKLVPLALFVIVGAFFVDPRRFAVAAPPTAAALSGAVLVAVYAFSGFEVLGVPSGEIDDPARTIPFALLAGLARRGDDLRRASRWWPSGRCPGWPPRRDHSPMRRSRCSAAQVRR